jgi:glycosyltransferase involved in cell wall biosynthesis
MSKNKAAINILTRDGKYIDAVLKNLIPAFDSIYIAVDSRSAKSYLDKLRDYSSKYENISVVNCLIENPKIDLVKARNFLLSLSHEKYVWIIDDDEYYPQWIIGSILGSLTESCTYALKAWHPWKGEMAHAGTSFQYIRRIFYNDRLNWRGEFGAEQLFAYKTGLTCKDNLNVKVLPYKYIHFTHVKEQVWRKEFGLERNATDRCLKKIETAYLKELKKLNKIYGY